MKKLLLVMFLMPTFAMAQQPAEREFNLKVSGTDVNVIGKALEALPYRDVAQLMERLRQQVVAQQMPDANKQPTPPAPPPAIPTPEAKK